MYKLKDKVLMQRDHRIKENVTIFQYVTQDNTDIDPADPIAVIAKNGVPYELNLSAGIIIEELVRGTDISVIYQMFIDVFGLDQRTARLSIDSYIEKMIDMNIIQDIS